MSNIININNVATGEDLDNLIKACTIAVTTPAKKEHTYICDYINIAVVTVLESINNVCNCLNIRL